MVLSCWLSDEVITERKGAPRWAPRESFRVCYLESGSRRLPGAFRKASERLGVAHGDVGEDLAVELDARLAQAVHELAVGEALAARRRVDARDPQAPEVALAVAPVAIRVGVGLEQLLLRALVRGVLLAPVALGTLENGAALLAGVDGALDPAHDWSSRLIRGASASEITTGFSSRRLRLALFLPRMWLVMACLPRTLPLAVVRKRFLAPEWVFIFGIGRLLKQTPLQALARAHRLP